MRRIAGPGAGLYAGGVTFATARRALQMDQTWWSWTSAANHSGWIPTFVDYLYLSLTNSSAFSPTDTRPLTTRAKYLMGFQATAALLTSLLVIARAIGSFGGSSN